RIVTSNDCNTNRSFFSRYTPLQRLRARFRATTIGNMMEPNRRLERILHRVVVGVSFLSLAASLVARPRSVAPNPPASPSPAPTKKSFRQEDSVFMTPAKDLLL